MSWLRALVAVCAVFSAEALLLRKGQVHHRDMDDSRFNTIDDLWKKFEQSVEGLPSGNEWATKYYEKLNMHYACFHPSRFALCMKLNRTFHNGELAKVFIKAVYISSLNGGDLDKIFIQSVLRFEGPHDTEYSHVDLWKSVFTKLPPEFLDDVLVAFRYDLSTTCTAEEIRYLLTSSEKSVPPSEESYETDDEGVGLSLW